MIVALCGQKGGTGKTTTAVSLAVEWSVRGRSVLLVDTDGQRSALTWADVAAERGAEHVPPTIALGEQLRRQLPPHLPGRDVVVIDCPPAHGERQRAALMVADLAVIPAVADATEVWALGETRRIVDEALAMREALRVALLVMRKDRRTQLGAQARQVLGQLGLPVLEAELSRRITYPEALVAGLGPTTYDPASVAAREVRRLATELELLGGLAPPTRPARKGHRK